jgi:hypothetical protein
MQVRFLVPKGMPENVPAFPTQGTSFIDGKVLEGRQIAVSRILWPVAFEKSFALQIKCAMGDTGSS